jgi:tetratricopeptide (TPR) repeat protein
MKRITGLCLSLVFLVQVPSIAFSVDESTVEFTQAEKQYDKGNYSEAEKWYQKAALKYQGMSNISAYIQNRFAECAEYQHRPDEAVKIYRKIQTDYPDTSFGERAQDKIARTYYCSGNYSKAGPEFEKVANNMTIEEDGKDKKSKNDRTHDAQKRTFTKYDYNLVIGYAILCHRNAGNYLKVTSLGLKIKK